MNQRGKEKGKEKGKEISKMDRVSVGHFSPKISRRISDASYRVKFRAEREPVEYKRNRIVARSGTGARVPTAGSSLDPTLLTTTFT